MKLSLTNYTVTYHHQEVSLLSNFSFSCPEAGLYLIHGANGAGKSTLFSSLCGYDLPARIKGTIKYENDMFEIGTHEYRKYAQKHIALVPQKYDELLSPGHTVKENLAMALFPLYPSILHSFPFKDIPDILKEIGLPLDIPVERMSGGQRQITAIMMALQKNKKILLLDEPTATLDPDNTALVMNFLVRLYKEKEILILMICHDPDLQAYTEHAPVIIKQ